MNFRNFLNHFNNSHERKLSVFHCFKRKIVQLMMITTTKHKFGGLAQSEERNVSNVEAPGSKPGFSISFLNISQNSERVAVTCIILSIKQTNRSLIAVSLVEYIN